MISRVADHCFWFGRYLERAESTARLLQTAGNLALDGDLTARQVWQPVVITAGEEEALAEKHGPDALADGERVQEHLSLDRGVDASILRSVQAARENARSIREVVSLEVWESINELHLWLQSPAAREEFSDHRYGFYKRVRQDAQLCLGLLRGTMLHDTPLHFIWLGVLIERSGQTARILDVHHHAFRQIAREKHSNSFSSQIQSLGGSPEGAGAKAHQSQSMSLGGMTMSQSQGAPPRAAEEGARELADVALWLSLLRTCYGFEPFMKLHRGQVTGEAASRFLIFEPRFPRSVRHCVFRVRELIEEIRPRGGTPSLARERARVLEELLDARAGEQLGEDAVHALLTEVVDQMHAVSDALGKELLVPDAQVSKPAQSDSQPPPDSRPFHLTSE